MSILGRLEARLWGFAQRIPGYRWIAEPRHRTFAHGGEQRDPTDSPERVPHADERTIRRRAEVELGGTSSEVTREAYERGDLPGGLRRGGKGPETPHHGYVAADETSIYFDFGGESERAHRKP
ncbi:MAG TPA: hypothetical protein VJT73_14810 [Polyangiaceae bacterium]|nr:hypothetical protein [Polyangiaceae bacterium]